MKAKKTKPAPLGSHIAPPRGQVLIEQLIKVRKQAAVLAKRSKLLRELIILAGGGSAHGVRTYVTFVPAATYTAHRKAHHELKVVEVK